MRGSTAPCGGGDRATDPIRRKPSRGTRADRGLETPNVHEPEPGPPATPWTLEHDAGEPPTLPIVAARLIRLYGSEDHSVDQVVQAETTPPLP
jgi:hypothetical protein